MKMVMSIIIFKVYNNYIHIYNNNNIFIINNNKKNILYKIWNLIWDYKIYMIICNMINLWKFLMKNLKIININNITHFKF